MKKIKLIVDSTADLPEHFLEKYDIDVVPLYIIWPDGSQEKDTWLDEEKMKFYQRLMESEEVPDTSQPTVPDFVAKYKELMEKGYDEILVLTISTQMSGTFNSATLAAKEVEIPVYVFDTLRASSIVALMARTARLLANQGKDSQEIIKIMKERFGAKNPKSMMLRFHTQTGGSTLTAQQPDNNIVRVTIQTLAAVLGGTQSLHTNSRDEALGLPTEDSVRIALRTQQIVAYESGVTNTVDPLAGSYFLESLTDKIEEKVWNYLKRIDEMGGMVYAIEKGYIQKEIQDAAYRYQQEVEKGDRVVVGVNKFTMEQEPPKEILRVDPNLRKVQAERLANLRAKRDNAKVQKTLNALKEAAKEEKENLMPFILDAAKAYATLGEICNVLRDVFGEYQESIVL